MVINEVITAPQSPWQNPFVESLIGSIRRGCLNHVIVLNESHLKRILTSYFEYYNNDRTHCSLDKDTPIARPMQHRPDNCGNLIELPRVGGRHHRYEWQQAA
jgi:transposase InsO family protein